MSVFIYSLLNALKSGDLNDQRLLYVMIGAIYALERDMKTNPSVEAVVKGDNGVQASVKLGHQRSGHQTGKKSQSLHTDIIA